MGEARPFASLSSGLLARKGAAKPAMRPQNFGQAAINYEDLGWNDMGHHGQAVAPHDVADFEAVEPARFEAPPVPEVVEQQRAIATSFGEKRPRPKTVRAKRQAADIVALQPRAARTSGSSEKAAFTLRLDQERHLKLRLACAVSNRSAQQIVTEALDQLLERLPEVESLARSLPATAGKRA